jgi:hypothetical protein
MALLPTLELKPQRQLVLVLLFGGIGAIASVMARITRGQLLHIEARQGRAITYVAGAFRPIVGSVLALAIYVLVQAGLLPMEQPLLPPQSFYFSAGLGFIAGFSERWAQDTILKSTPIRSTMSEGSEVVKSGSATPPSHAQDADGTDPDNRRP